MALNRYTPRSRRVTIDASIYWDNEEGTDGFNAELEIEFEITGEYQRATWGYYGGSPEEWPEAEAVEICWNGQAVPDAWIFGDGPDGVWDPPWKDQIDMEALTRQALEEDAREPEYDGPYEDEGYGGY